MFSTMTTLKHHIKSAHEKCADHECKICGKKLSSWLRLRGHMDQCHSQVTCEICQKTASNPIELKKHKVFVHNDLNGAWLCEKCPKRVFFVKLNYENHMKNKH